MVSFNFSEEEIISQNDEDIEEGEIDLSSLSSEEKDALILEMQAEEIMEEQRKLKKEEQPVKRKKKRKKKAPKKVNPVPGFGWVVIKMSSAMTFSMVFAFLGPILFFMAIFKGYGLPRAYDWKELVFGIIGIGLTVASGFLFKYIIKD